MPSSQILKLTLADVTSTEDVRRLLGHGEDVVERKRQMPSPEQLGAEVASFGNTAGGWVAIGVKDDGTVVGVTVNPRDDLQSTIGNLLRPILDPMPLFAVDTRSIDRHTVILLRVSASDDVPILHCPTGTIYVRDAGGKNPIRSRQALLELVDRGHKADSDARQRVVVLPHVFGELVPPDAPSDQIAQGPDDDHVRHWVRAAPLTVSREFADWAVSNEVEAACEEMVFKLMPKQQVLDSGLADTRPLARGVVSRRALAHPAPSGQATAVIDSGGVVGVRLDWLVVGSDMVVPQAVTRDLQNMLEAVVSALDAGGVTGTVAVDMWLSIPERLSWYSGGQYLPVKRNSHASDEMTLPVEDGEVQRVVDNWVRQLLRAAGSPSGYAGSPT